MSHLYLVGDLHFGSKGIINLRRSILPPEIQDVYDYGEWVVDRLNFTLRKRDRVIFMGDLLDHKDFGHYVDRIQGYKILIAGNHDRIEVRDHVKEVHGVIKKKGIWLTHIPIHPQELYGKVNVHGHSHWNGIDDPRYLNICQENMGWDPVPFEDVKEIMNNVRHNDTATTS